MKYDHNLDDYGWYEVGNQRFYNKFQALIAHKEQKVPIRWNYNDTAYDQWDWTHEPVRSLDQLYAERARDIRDRYDYLVLHFSGGSDSTNVLETFVRNRIPLDEIITRGSFSQSSGKRGILESTDIYSECLNQAVPLAQWAKDNHYPNLKITVVETTRIILDYFKNNPLWYENGAGGLTPAIILKQNIDILSSHYRDLTDKGLRIAHIYGVDKPQLHFNKNIYYTQWADGLLAEFSSPRTLDQDRPQYIELFYSGCRAIEIQIKQLHVLKNLCAREGYRYSPKDGRQYDNWVAKAIYDRALPLWCEHKKEWLNNSVVQPKDAWFEQHPNHDSYQIWQRGVHHLQNSVPEYFLNSSNGRIVALMSRPRYLGR